jgi:hypothetical protein
LQFYSSDFRIPHKEREKVGNTLLAHHHGDWTWLQPTAFDQRVDLP